MTSALPEIKRDADLYEVSIDAGRLAVDRLVVGRALGYGPRQMPDYFGSMIDSIILQLPGRCAIRAGYRLAGPVKPDGRGEGFHLHGKFFGAQKIVTGRMRGAEQAACFVGTIGPEMEHWSRELMAAGDPVMGHLVDTVASVAAESVAQLVHDHIAEKMRASGLQVTNRYSPGYCGWQVSEQHALFSFFPPNFCGVTLSDSALMQPIKSVSGVVGIGSEVRYAAYGCEQCGNTACTYRAIQFRKKQGSR